MAKYSYSTKIGEKDAAAVGISLPISTKQSIEICNFIRGKKLERAKVILSNVINEKQAIPFNRFTDGIGHKAGKIAGGRFPKRACTEILKMINSAQANAQFKGLSSADLIVRHISAQKASATWHYGRRRAKAKRTTIEVVLTEKMEAGNKAEAKKEEKPKSEEKKAEPAKKAEEKKVVEEKPKEEKKPAEKKEEPKKAEEKPKAEEKKEEPKPEPTKKETKKDTGSPDKKTQNPKEENKEAKAEQ
jgi:large subunit ribosomal protein L22